MVLRRVSHLPGLRAGFLGGLGGALLGALRDLRSILFRDGDPVGRDINSRNR